MKERVSYQEQQLRKHFIEQVLRVGYPSVTVSSLTDAAGISRTSFYLFFSGKAELAEYVCYSYLETFNYYLSKCMTHFYLPDVREHLMKAFDDMRRNADTIRSLWAINEESFSPYLLMQESITDVILRHIGKISKADDKDQKFFAMTFSASAMATIKFFLSDDCQDQSRVVDHICTCCFYGQEKILHGSDRGIAHC